jgi:hypothetical protein
MHFLPRFHFPMPFLNPATTAYLCRLNGGARLKPVCSTRMQEADR